TRSLHMLIRNVQLQHSHVSILICPVHLSRTLHPVFEFNLNFGSALDNVLGSNDSIRGKDNARTVALPYVDYNGLFLNERQVYAKRLLSRLHKFTNCIATKGKHCEDSQRGENLFHLKLSLYLVTECPLPG